MVGCLSPVSHRVIQGTTVAAPAESVRARLAPTDEKPATSPVLSKQDARHFFALIICEKRLLPQMMSAKESQDEKGIGPAGSKLASHVRMCYTTICRDFVSYY